VNPTRLLRIPGLGIGLVLAGLLVCAQAVTGFAGNTYMTDLSPNVEVTEPDCYSFTIAVNQASGTSALLALRVYDVDEEAGELDTVSLNGIPLGTLSGTNETWSTTTFNITGAVNYLDVDGGINTVEICIDPGGGEPTEWVAEIDWGQILIDGGSAADADIVSLAASGTWSAIQVDTAVHATNTDTYRLEINLLDSVGNNYDIAVDTFLLSGGSSTTRVNTVALPSEPLATETFTVEANLFNQTTGVLQHVLTTTWTYVSNDPPTAGNASVLFDEDTPYVFAAGDFGYSDSDGDPLDHIRITSLEGVGDLTVGGLDAISNQVVTAAQLAAGQLVYTPLPEEHGAPYDSFRFDVHDGTEYSASDYLMSVAVSPVDDPVIASSDTGSVDEDGMLNIAAPGVLGNDSHVDGGASVIVVDDVDHGSLSLNLDGSYTYVPVARYSGADRFVYELSDADGDTAQAAVELEVLHVNHPPKANAGGSYRGVVGREIELSAWFSSDPDVEDRLQYRWDLNGNGTFDTGWLDQARWSVMYEEPFAGLATLEVRDLYRFQPTGATSSAQALVIVTERPPEIHSVLFLDLDGNGVKDGSDVSLAEIPLLLDGATLVYTNEDGQVAFPDLVPGEHRVEIPEEGLELLDSRGYSVEEFVVTVVAAPGEPTLVLFASQRIVGTVRGVVFTDLNGSAQRDGGEPGVAGVRVTIDGESSRTTAGDGLFLFLNIRVGEHRLTVSAERGETEVMLLVLGGTETVVDIALKPEAADGGFLDVKVEREPVVSSDGG